MSAQVWFAILIVTLTTIFPLHKLMKKHCRLPFYANLHQSMKLFWFVWVNVILNVYSNVLTVKMNINHYEIEAPFQNVTELFAMVANGDCDLVANFADIDDYVDTYILEALNRSSDDRISMNSFSLLNQMILVLHLLQ